LWRTWPQWIRSLHGWISWCGKQKVRTNHNSQWKGTLARQSDGLPDLRLFSSRLKKFYCIYINNQENSIVIRKQVINWESQFHQKWTELKGYKKINWSDEIFRHSTIFLITITILTLFCKN
jgi:hypothetical protein